MPQGAQLKSPTDLLINDGDCLDLFTLSRQLGSPDPANPCFNAGAHYQRIRCKPVQLTDLLRANGADGKPGRRRNHESRVRGSHAE